MLAIIFVFVVMAIIVAFTSKADNDEDDDYSMSYQFGQSSPYYSPPRAPTHPLNHHHLDQPINAGQNYHIHNETDVVGSGRRKLWKESVDTKVSIPKMSSFLLNTDLELSVRRGDRNGKDLL